MSKALIVIDMQNDFIDGVLGTPEAQAILPEICATIKDHLDAGEPVILTKDTHFDDYLETLEGQKLNIPHCIKGTDGHCLAPSIEIVLSDYTKDKHYAIIEKNTFGAHDLADTLDDLLWEMELDDELESITFVGVCTGICVISNVAIIKANYPGVPIYVRADACACVTPETHRQALEAMKVFQIEVTEA